MALARRSITARAIVALVTLFALSAALATTPARHAVAQSADMSPDEAALQFRPYVLTKDNAPAGLATGSPFVWTPELYAYATRDEFGMSPSDALSQFEADGLVLVFGQILNGASPSTGPANASFNALLMRSSEQAQKFVDLQAIPEALDRSNIQATNVAPRVGEYSVLYRFNAGKQNDVFSLRWARGQIVYAVYGPASDGPDGYAALAKAIDTVEVTNAPVDLSKPNLVPPATDTERLQVLLRPESIEPSTVALPNGFRAEIPTTASTVGLVLTSSDPAATLARYDESWQRVMHRTRQYTLADGEILYLDLSEDASSAAARVDERDVLLPPGDTVTPVAAGVSFGDDNFAYMIAGTNQDGSQFESLRYSWLHGPLLLSVQLTAQSGTVDNHLLLTFAQAVEDAYQQSAYVGN